MLPSAFPQYFQELGRRNNDRRLGKVLFKGQELTVQSVADVVAGRPDIALFSAGSSASREWAPRFAAAGCRVVDNSSCWRMDPTKKLVVPEINGDVLTAEDFIIANPNCSTSQMLVRFRRDVLDLRPRYVVIIAGINDIARNQGYISQENSIGNILSMCELAVANGIEPVLSTLIPASKVVWRPAITNTRELVAAFNAELRAHAAERGFKLIDFEQLLADENGNTRPDLSEDTIHPTLAGYKIFEEAVLKALQ